MGNFVYTIVILKRDLENTNTSDREIFRISLDDEPNMEGIWRAVNIPPKRAYNRKAKELTK